MPDSITIAILSRADATLESSRRLRQACAAQLTSSGETLGRTRLLVEDCRSTVSVSRLHGLLADVNATLRRLRQVHAQEGDATTETDLRNAIADAQALRLDLRDLMQEMVSSGNSAASAGVDA